MYWSKIAATTWMPSWLAIPLHGWPAASQAEGGKIYAFAKSMQYTFWFFGSNSLMSRWKSWRLSLVLKQPTSTKSVRKNSMIQLFCILGIFTPDNFGRFWTRLDRRCTRQKRTQTAALARWKRVENVFYFFNCCIFEILRLNGRRKISPNTY